MFEIWTNARVNQTLYFRDGDGGWLFIEPDEIFEAWIKKSRNDADAVIKFATGGGVGKGTIAVVQEPLSDGTPRSGLAFETADQSLTEELVPGRYRLGIKQTALNEHFAEARVEVIKGIPTP
jgi:hypothetical protein